MSPPLTNIEQARLVILERPPNYQCIAFCLRSLLEARGWDTTCPEMVCTIQIRSLGYRLYNPYLGESFFWKSQTFSKSLETFGSQIFFFKVVKPIGRYRFSYGFFKNVLHLCFVESYYNCKFYKGCSVNHTVDHILKRFCIKGWCLVHMLLMPLPLKEIHRLAPMD